jgi:hypothetical protein
LNHENGLLQHENSHFAAVADILRKLFSSIRLDIEALCSVIRKASSLIELALETTNDDESSIRHLNLQNYNHAAQGAPTAYYYRKAGNTEIEEGPKVPHELWLDNRPLPEPPRSNHGSKADALETELTLDNALIRLVIAYNKGLVFQVLPRSLPQICREAFKLQSLRTADPVPRHIQEVWDKIDITIRHNTELSQTDHSKCAYLNTENLNQFHDRLMCPEILPDQALEVSKSYWVDRGPISPSQGTYSCSGSRGCVQSLAAPAMRVQSCQGTCTACVKIDIQKRIIALRKEQCYYRHRIREISFQVVPMMKCYADELLSILQDFESNEHRYSRAFQQDLRSRGINPCNPLYP